MKPCFSKLLFFIFTSLFFYSCDPHSTFNQAQPADIASEKIFPKKLIGHYLCKKNNAVLFIMHNKIIKSYNVELFILKQELDTTLSYKLFKDTLLDIISQKKHKVQYSEDTIHFIKNFTDTIFQISEEQVLKRWNDYYFLNQKSRNEWLVRKMEFNNNTIIITPVLTLSEVENLQKEPVKKISKLNNQTPDTKNKIFKRPLKGFNTKDLFYETEIYVRINN